MAVKQLPKVVKTISDISSVLPTITHTLTKPSKNISEILPEEESRLIAAAREIMRGYAQPAWVAEIPPLIMQEHLMTLQSLKMEIASRCAPLMSYSESLADELKLARAKVGHQVRQEQARLEATGQTVRITVEDIKDLAYTKTEALWKSREQARMESDSYRQVYFAIRDCCEMLDRCLHRIWMLEKDLSAS